MNVGPKLSVAPTHWDHPPYRTSGGLAFWNDDRILSDWTYECSNRTSHPAHSVFWISVRESVARIRSSITACKNPAEASKHLATAPSEHAPLWRDEPAGARSAVGSYHPLWADGLRCAR